MSDDHKPHPKYVRAYCAAALAAGIPTSSEGLMAHLRPLAKLGVDALQREISRFNAQVAKPLLDCEARRLEERARFVESERHRRFEEWLERQKDLLGEQAAAEFAGGPGYRIAATAGALSIVQFVRVLPGGRYIRFAARGGTEPLDAARDALAEIAGSVALKE
jgi:hypothetical protein